MTYKETGLCNIAFCYSPIGNVLKVKKYYEQTMPNKKLKLYGEKRKANT